MLLMAIFMPMVALAEDSATPDANGNLPVMATWNDYADSNNPTIDATKYMMHIFCDSGSGIQDIASAPVVDKKVPLNLPSGQNTCYMRVLNTIDNVYSAPSLKITVTVP